MTEKEEILEPISQADEDGTKEKRKDEKKEHKKLKEECKNLEKQVKELTEETEKLRAENIDYLNKVKYSQAELINYRKRKDEEIAQKEKYCNKDIICDILPVIDNFERAIKLDDNDLTDELSKFLSGFKIMYSDLNNILIKYGVSEINRVGEEFDPNLEQALITDKVPDKKDDEVLEVLLKGYKLKDRVIRPATVKINKLD